MRPVGWLSILTLFITLLLNFNIPLTLSSFTQQHLAHSFLGSSNFYENVQQAYTQPLMGLTTIFNNTLIFDHFTCFIKSIILLSALFSILISFAYIKSVKINSFEYFLLILFSTFSMLWIVSSYDMISMYLAIELQSLAFYVLAAYQRNSEFSTEAGLKYFILGALSSGLLLLGQSLVYGFTGLTQFEELGKLFLFRPVTMPIEWNVTTLYTIDPNLPAPDSINLWMTQLFSTNGTLALLGLLFILFAFLFKIGAVPFQMWLPDVYEGSPTSVTAFFSITPKIAIIALLLRLCLYTFYDLMPWWQSIVLICALLSIYIGTFGALNQNKIKRLFAYSSIAHVGYLLIGLGTGSIEAVESILIYIIVYIITALNVFGILLVLSWAKPSSGLLPSKIPLASPNPNQNSHSSQMKLPSLIVPYVYKLSTTENYLKQSLPLHRDNRDHGKNMMTKESKLITSFACINRHTGTSPGHIKFMSDLSPIARSNPLLALTFAVILFSNAGVPPLAGFYGKLNIFLAAIESHMYFVAIAGIICSVIGAFYSIRLVKILYFHRMSLKSWPQWKTISRENAILLACTFFFTLFFFLKPSFLFIAAHNAALAICI